MKKTFVAVVSFLFAYVSLAEPMDYFLMFETYGDDCYADGSLVMDGECYALVWRDNSIKDKEEGLFYADGTPIDPTKCEVLWIFPAGMRFQYKEDEEVVDSPLLTGACADRSLVKMNQTHLSEKGSHGVYSIFLFDTRIWNGSDWAVGGQTAPKALTVKALNGYGLVTDLEDIKKSPRGPDDPGPVFFAYDTLRHGDPPLSLPEDDPLFAGLAQGDDSEYYSGAVNMTVIPATAPVPQISAFSLASGEVTLSVTNTAPYLAYDISMTNDLAKVHSTTNFVGGIKQGAGAGPLTWTIPVGAEKQGFFKVLPRTPDFSK